VVQVAVGGSEVEMDPVYQGCSAVAFASAGGRLLRAKPAVVVVDRYSDSDDSAKALALQRTADAYSW
jgi:C-terminal processing protease CtpA/Prc